jgi:hypothetical protein
MNAAGGRQPNPSRRCRQHPLSLDDIGIQPGSIHAATSSLLGVDFLAPVIANMLFRDLVQSMVPMQLLPDRAAALEMAFEESWRNWCLSSPRLCKNPDLLKSSFLSLRESNRWTPILMLNGTHQESGRRIITSHVSISQDAFTDAYDFFHVTNRSIAASTAVMNSARFPYISPAGSLTRAISDANGVRLERLGHVLDGGFFENFGDTTSQEALKAALKRLADQPKKSWKPLVIEIVNDVTLREEELFRFRNAEIENGDTLPPLSLTGSGDSTSGFADQLFGPAAGLYATRSARGVLASKNLADVVRQNDGELIQLRLCPQMEPSPPLGWLLTSDSRRAMDELVLGHSPARRAVNFGHLAEYSRCFQEIQSRIAKIIKLLG